MLLTMHHIVFDGWSFTVLLRELSRAYEARAAGRVPELPRCRSSTRIMQSGNESARFAAKRWSAHSTIWRNQLAGMPVLELSADQAPARDSAVSWCAAPDHDPACGLRQVCARSACQQGMTLFMTLLTVFKILLYRYRGRTDIVVGVPNGQSASRRNWGL